MSAEQHIKQSGGFIGMSLNALLWVMHAAPTPAPTHFTLIYGNETNDISPNSLKMVKGFFTQMRLQLSEEPFSGPLCFVLTILVNNEQKTLRMFSGDDVGF